MPPNPPRVIPTERLASLCEDFRDLVDRNNLGRGILSREIGEDQTLPEPTRLRWLSILDSMRAKAELLVATEMYLKYNKGRILKSRAAARERREEAFVPTFLAPNLHDHLPHKSFTLEDNIAAAESFEGPVPQLERKINRHFTPSKSEVEHARIDALFASNQAGIRTQLEDELQAGRTPPKHLLDLAKRYNIDPELYLPPAPAPLGPEPSSPLAAISLPNDTEDYFGLGEDGVFEALPAKLARKKNWIP